MRRHTLLITIVFAYLVTIGSMGYSFWEFNKINEEQYTNHIFNKYQVITQVYFDHVQKKSPPAVLEANLAVYDIYPVVESAKIKFITKHALELKNESFQTMNEKHFYSHKSGVYKRQYVITVLVSMLEYKNDIFFYIQTPTKVTLLLDKSLKPYSNATLLYTFAILIFVVSIMYLMILRRIAPLKRLQKQIASMGEGKLNVSFAIKGEGEVAMVANELQIAQSRIASLIESRTLFMRNIMHELKTPIAKGMILSRMLEEGKQKERYVSIFERLEMLISEFALIEEVTSGIRSEAFKEYRLIDLIDDAIDMAMVDAENLTIDVSAECKVNADFKLFSTAIKNMIDNAMKYSHSKHLCICSKSEEIYFENDGDRLEKPLAYYVEPFTKNNASKDSFGLGLYLVDSILKMHQMELAYEFEEGINRFIFVQPVRASTV